MYGLASQWDSILLEKTYAYHLYKFRLWHPFPFSRANSPLADFDLTVLRTWLHMVGCMVGLCVSLYLQSIPRKQLETNGDGVFLIMGISQQFWFRMVKYAISMQTLWLDFWCKSLAIGITKNIKENVVSLKHCIARLQVLVCFEILCKFFRTYFFYGIFIHIFVFFQMLQLKKKHFSYNLMNLVINNYCVLLLDAFPIQ